MNITFKTMMIIALLMSTVANLSTDRWWETMLKLCVAVSITFYFEEKPRRARNA